MIYVRDYTEIPDFVWRERAQIGSFRWIVRSQ
jgi:hypothetical protein